MENPKVEPLCLIFIPPRPTATSSPDQKPVCVLCKRLRHFQSARISCRQLKCCFRLLRGAARAARLSAGCGCRQHSSSQPPARFDVGAPLPRQQQQPWTPQLGGPTAQALRELGTIAGARAAVDEELRRSLLASHAAVRDAEHAAGLLSKVLWRSHDVLDSIDREGSDTVLLHDGRVIVDEQFFNVSKHAGHLAFVVTAMQRQRLPNAAYRLSTVAKGACSSTHTRAFGPYFVISKATGYGECGSLMPNPYLPSSGNLSDWTEYSGKLEREASKRPFERRIGKLFWRGDVRSRTGSARFFLRMRVRAGYVVRLNILVVRRAGARAIIYEICKCLKT